MQKITVFFNATKLLDSRGSNYWGAKKGQNIGGNYRRKKGQNIGGKTGGKRIYRQTNNFKLSQATGRNSFKISVLLRGCLEITLLKS